MKIFSVWTRVRGWHCAGEVYPVDGSGKAIRHPNKKPALASMGPPPRLLQFIFWKWLLIWLCDHIELRRQFIQRLQLHGAKKCIGVKTPRSIRSIGLATLDHCDRSEDVTGIIGAEFAAIIRDCVPVQFGRGLDCHEDSDSF